MRTQAHPGREQNPAYVSSMLARACNRGGSGGTHYGPDSHEQEAGISWEDRCGLKNAKQADTEGCRQWHGSHAARMPRAWNPEVYPVCSLFQEFTHGKSESRLA